MLGVAAASTLRILERRILNDADLVLTDTTLHVNFYQEEYSLHSSKLVALPVGAEEILTGDDPLQCRSPAQPEGEMSVLFYGSFLPLHGIEIILKAASLARDLPIRFDFVGGNKEQVMKLKASCTGFGINRYTHRPWVAFEELIKQTIPEADLCLGGPFGGYRTSKKSHYRQDFPIPGTWQADHYRQDRRTHWISGRQNCLLVPQGHPQALADAIRWAFEQRRRCPRLASGRLIYSEKLSVNVIRHRLSQILSDLRKNK